MHSLRKKPFSAKQKKTQIQAKRAKKREQAENEDDEWDFNRQPNPDSTTQQQQQQKDAATPANNKPVVGSDGRRVNKLTSQFDKLSRVEIEANKHRSMLPLQRLSGAEGLTMSFDDAYSADVDIPVRPVWSYGESRESLERREERAHSAWLENINRLRDMETVSLYEKNLEVWRQLWRVVEISDVLLMVVDVRHPVLHFPPSLYRYITETTGKPLVVVLNKTDLVADATVRAWKSYFKQQFPSVVLTSFCCYRNSSSNDVVNDIDLAGLKLKKSKPRRRTYDSTLVGDLFEACRSVCESQKRDLVDWDSLIARYRTQSADGGEDKGDESEEEDGNSDNEDEEEGEGVKEEAAAAVPGEGHIETVSGRYVTLGLVGHPNVGKSTVINSIMGRTVVSTSRTPGHTKHFQTIHVTPTLRLCDCPGLVFPCVVNRPLQVLAGLYNIAQIQEPYTSVQYLAERVPVEQLLSLRMPDHHQQSNSAMEGGRRQPQWSAWAICEAFAVDRGFYTSKAARPDVYRAALHILRWELDGRILMSFKPPGFFDDHANFVDGTVDAEQKKGGSAATRGVASEDLHSHSASEPSSSDDDNEVRRPIGQQSAFALLGEEDC
ncbi:hypothetical protein H4R27_003781 [Coemansia aciculifera]|uniref:Guanine nucleotide-binding protein-like 1 n=1 Tax=Coemansia pectinata TaxID=1052879 RepID=A0A9W8H011_9FUNG|nr:hypothetical protein GGI19_000087 [Coemansia pectinata]KAJ2881919.1 hypothetical protein H4R27_003781 [Coemansia aciculifera]